MEKNINKQELENNELEINENDLESVSGGEDMTDEPCVGRIRSSNVVGCLAHVCEDDIILNRD